MKKFSILALVGLAVCSTAMAQGKKAPKPSPRKMHCAVMTKDPVNIEKATKDKMFADYKGRRYFFCCAGCPAAFKANPAKYAKNDSIPTPKKKKA